VTLASDYLRAGPIAVEGRSVTDIGATGPKRRGKRRKAQRVMSRRTLLAPADERRKSSLNLLHLLRSPIGTQQTRRDVGDGAAPT
jgi:hypothetical protein